MVVDLSGKTLKEIVEMTEKAVIQDSLIRNDWNQTKVAYELDMTRKTISKKIKEYGITR